MDTWTIPTDLAGSVAADLLCVATEQTGVVRRSHLHRIGVTDRQIDRFVNARRWQLVAGVVVLHNTSLTEPQQLAVATSVNVRLVALAARTAAAQGGLQGWPAGVPELLVPRGTTYPQLPFEVQVHESRRFHEDDRLDVWPPRVRMERALIDAAAWSIRTKPACGILAAGVQQRLTQAERLSAELHHAGKVRHKQLLRRVLDDIAGGAHALSEVEFLNFCRRHGFPRPTQQSVRYDARGRRRYLDATFTRADGSLLRVEVDGALHLLVLTYWDDMARDNELVIDDEKRLRFASFAIYADDPRAVDQLRRALAMSVVSRRSAA